MDSYSLPKPVTMTADELTGLVKAVYGSHIKFTDYYHEADYIAVLEDLDGYQYVIFKLDKTVDRLEAR